MEMVGLEEPILAMMTSVKINPIHRPFGESDLVGDEAPQGNARDHGVLEALAKRGLGAMKIAARELLFQGCGSGRNSVKFHGGAGWIACDCEGLGVGKIWETKRIDCKQQCCGQNETVPTRRGAMLGSSQAHSILIYLD